MVEFLNLLKQNSESLTIIFTGVVTLSTVFYAALTGWLVVETKKIREVQTEPRIHIAIESYDFAINIVRLKIQNIGLGLASDMKFVSSVIKGDNSAKELLKDFTQSNFFKIGLRNLGPGQSIYSADTNLTEEYEGKIASVLSFKVEYKNSTKKSCFEEIIIDMSEIKGKSQLGKPHLYSIANSLEKIQTDFHRIASGARLIKIDVYSSDDRKSEKKELKKSMNKI